MMIQACCCVTENGNFCGTEIAYAQDRKSASDLAMAGSIMVRDPNTSNWIGRSSSKKIGNQVIVVEDIEIL
jgi:hypothetical protein